jgi:hypothetical protein
MPLLTKGKTNWKYILIVLILAVIVGGGILGYCWWIAKEKISLPPVKKPGIQAYPPQIKELIGVIEIPATSLISLKENETVWIEGVYWGNNIRWAGKGGGNGICFKEKIDVPEDSVIKAKIRIIETKEGVCSEGEMLEYETIYTGEEIRKIASQFSSICPEIENFINQERKEYPIQLSTCLGFYGEKFTRFDYEWIPFASKFIASIRGGSKSWNKYGSKCHDSFGGAILVDPIKNKIERIYLGEIKEVCVIY